MEHLPAVQEVLSHGAEVLHTAQAPPPVPQPVMEVPAWQVVPVQHPAQVLAAQVPPQPSPAPGHLLVQSGAHTHLSCLQTRPVAQVPQVPPQPLGPHSLPSHLGVQGVQRPLRQIMLLAVQSTQLAPEVPHWSFWEPVTQPAVGEQHPAQVLLLQPHRASGQGAASRRPSESRSLPGTWSAGAARSAGMV